MKFFRLFLIGMLLLFPWSCWAISFDIWETGISRQEMTEKAQQQNIPLAKDGLHHSNKTFNQKLLVGEANSFYYFTTLLDHTAKVHLTLSPKKANYGQFLYEIDVLFSDPRKNRDLRPYLLKLLEGKYGPGKIQPDFVRKIWFWHPEMDGEVKLIATSASLQLKYTDIKIKNFAEKLAKSTYKLPEKPMNHQDANKF